MSHYDGRILMVTSDYLLNRIKDLFQHSSQRTKEFYIIMFQMCGSYRQYRSVWFTFFKIWTIIHSINSQVYNHMVLFKDIYLLHIKLWPETKYIYLSTLVMLTYLSEWVTFSSSQSYLRYTVHIDEKTNTFSKRTLIVTFVCSRISFTFFIQVSLSSRWTGSYSTIRSIQQHETTH